MSSVPHRHRRTNRSAAERRAQYKRAHARQVQSLLQAFRALDHRGCQPTALGRALATALSSEMPPPAAHGTQGHTQAEPAAEHRHAESFNWSPAAPEFFPSAGNTAFMVHRFVPPVVEISEGEEACDFLELPQVAPAVPTVTRRIMRKIPPDIVSASASSSFGAPTAEFSFNSLGDAVWTTMGNSVAGTPREALRDSTPWPTPQQSVSSADLSSDTTSIADGEPIKEHGVSLPGAAASSGDDSIRLAEPSDEELQMRNYMRLAGLAEDEIDILIAEQIASGSLQ